MKWVLLTIIAIQAQAQFGIVERTHYLKEALDALSSSRYRSLVIKKSFAEMLMRQRCTSSFPSLKTQCLVNETARACSEKGNPGEGKRCKLIFDVVIVNLLNQDVFLKPEERSQILKKFPPEEIGIELNRRYGALCTEFLFSHFFGKEQNKKHLPESIDNFCLSRASLGKLSWQTCTSAMVWFMGTSRS